MSELLELASRLIAVDSVNPVLVAGGAGERECAHALAAWCEAHALETRLVGPDDRPSLVAVKRGAGGGRSLLLNGHLDTVGVGGMEDPFGPRLEDGRLYGRGSYDMKGAIAALAVAAAGLPPLRGDVIVTAVADEELGSLGTEEILRHISADAAIVAEPTALEVAVAHRGFVGFEIETAGVAAHGSMPHLGVDAIVKMGPVLVALDELGDALANGSRHPLAGPGAIHASVIHGGQEMSSYPARCVLMGERRTIPGETAVDVERELHGIAGDAQVRILAHRDPYEAPQDHAFVQLVRDTAGGPTVGAPFWTDAALIAAAGIPTVLLGPAGEGAHAEVEWVDVASLERLRELLVQVAREWCA
ncbi:MAG: M20/M25/M40 family metallo-hydrolase [Actinomycetota bacterium]